MSTYSNISLPVSTKQIFDLVQLLPKKDKKRLISLLEEEQYTNNIPVAHKKIVRGRIAVYRESPEKLVDEKSANRLIKEM